MHTLVSVQSKQFETVAHMHFPSITLKLSLHFVHSPLSLHIAQFSSVLHNLVPSEKRLSK